MMLKTNKELSEYDNNQKERRNSTLKLEKIMFESQDTENIKQLVKNLQNNNPNATDNSVNDNKGNPNQLNTKLQNESIWNNYYSNLNNKYELYYTSKEGTTLPILSSLYLIKSYSKDDFPEEE